MEEYRIDRSGRVWTKMQYVLANNPNHAISTIGMNAKWDALTPVNIQAYDSKADTLEHIKHVNTFLLNSAHEIIERAKKHDNSKLDGIEKELFDKETPILKELTYGSPEYKDSLTRLKPALDNHYAENSHHPEHYVNGIDGMDLFDVLEMLNDWKAATIRTADGDIVKSLEINKTRFNISDQMQQILLNTVERYGWL